MESFGLFDLLKSLSLFNQPTPSSTQTQKDLPPPSPPTSPPTAPTADTPPTPPKNACLEFINRHDELAKRRKRK